MLMCEWLCKCARINSDEIINRYSPSPLLSHCFGGISVKNVSSSPAVDSPRVPPYFMLSVIRCGCSFSCLFYPPNPPWISQIPRPTYTPPLPSFLPSPALFLSPPLFLLLLSLLSCCWHRLSSSSPLLSNNVCIHPPKAPHTHPHRSTDMLTPTQTHFEGFPRVRHRSISSLCSPPVRKIICPLSPQVSHPSPSACQPSQSPSVLVFRYIRHSSRMPFSYASRLAGCRMDLKLTLSSRWLAASGDLISGLSYHMMRKRILLSC